ncbi:hypothetical protein [Thiomicrorhabdus sp. Kp2]|uniref:hypothetical protein n=1 Tax=Thiomicrorhabdus sp. Kp2 TaxID=1123518 RepID=UPI0004280738|nr:hypothetical protein [Thiomicrorhabdus sp. Kp2]
MKVDKHAYKVVDGFKKSLSKEQRKVLNDENFEELQILVEAALGATAENVLHRVAKDVEVLAKKIRKKTRFIDELDD